MLKSLTKQDLVVKWTPSKTFKGGHDDANHQVHKKLYQPHIRNFVMGMDAMYLLASIIIQTLSQNCLFL